MRLPFSILAAALVCGAATVAPALGQAPEEASFALRPLKYDPVLPATKSYFVLAARPGDLIQDQVRVVNTGGKTGTAYLYTVDATTGQTSGAVYLSRQAARRDVGRWIRLSRPRITLAAGKSAVVDFTIRVPRAARPGDHLGGVVAENAEVQTSRGGGSLQIRIRHLTIAAVEVELPGRAVGTVDVTGVRPGGEHGYQYVYLHLKSTGTVMVKPALALAVRNAAGQVVARRAMQLDTFVPGTEIDFPALLPKRALSPGRYTARVRVHSSDNRVPGYRETAVLPFDVTRSFSFTVSAVERAKVFSGVAPVTPPGAKRDAGKPDYVRFALVALIGLLLVLFVLLLVLLRRVRGRKQAPPPPATASEAAAAPAPVSSPEPEPAWANLLAAYDSQPRRESAPESRFELRPEPWFDPEPEVELERPAAPVLTPPARPPVHAEQHAGNVSSALIDAGLLALATVIATRLLKSPS